ncbi:MAG: hypothetical protein R3F37_13660 [Candidatus Competibacteraceae bacterium]
MNWKKLLGAVDEVIAALTRQTEQSLKNADAANAANNADERARYEALFDETNVRLGELQLTRDQVSRKVDELKTRLETLRNAQ